MEKILPTSLVPEILNVQVDGFCKSLLWRIGVETPVQSL